MQTSVRKEILKQYAGIRFNKKKKHGILGKSRKIFHNSKVPSKKLEILK